VIGVDLAGSDVNVDLATGDGRATLVSEVTRLSGGTVDGVVANAGLATPTATTVSVDFYGTVPARRGPARRTARGDGASSRGERRPPLR